MPTQRELVAQAIAVLDEVTELRKQIIAKIATFSGRSPTPEEKAALDEIFAKTKAMDANLERLLVESGFVPPDGEMPEGYAEPTIQ